MKHQELARRFKAHFRVIPLEQIALAPWNYKRDDEKTAHQLVEKLKRNGQIINITVRQYPDDEPHEKPYEVVDGNHRLIALRELGYEAAIAYVIGTLSKREAMRLAVEINEGDFEPDLVKLSFNIQEMLHDWTPAELATTFPYSEEGIINLANLKEFDWAQFERPDDTIHTPSEEKEDLTLTFIVASEEAKANILAEIERIMQVCGYPDDQVGQGLALEKMAALSATTPITSLK